MVCKWFIQTYCLNRINPSNCKFDRHTSRCSETTVHTKPNIIVSIMMIIYYLSVGGRGGGLLISNEPSKQKLCIHCNKQSMCICTDIKITHHSRQLIEFPMSQRHFHQNNCFFASTKFTSIMAALLLSIICVTSFINLTHNNFIQFPQHLW